MALIVAMYRGELFGGRDAAVDFGGLLKWWRRMSNLDCLVRVGGRNGAVFDEENQINDWCSKEFREEAI